jgi:hypothetical protein
LRTDVLPTFRNPCRQLHFRLRHPAVSRLADGSAPGIGPA